MYRRNPLRKRFINGSISLPIGRYVVIPITENAGDCSEFQLKIYFDSGFKVKNSKLSGFVKYVCITPGYKIILENESTIDPVKNSINKKDMITKMSDRLHKGGKYEGVIEDNSSMRVRTHKDSPGDWLIKHEISTNSWASGIMAPFNCDHLINTKGLNEDIVKAGLHDKTSKGTMGDSIKKAKFSKNEEHSNLVPSKSMIDQMGRKKDNFKAFSEEVIEDENDLNLNNIGMSRV